MVPLLEPIVPQVRGKLEVFFLGQLQSATRLTGLHLAAERAGSFTVYSLNSNLGT